MIFLWDEGLLCRTAFVNLSCNFIGLNLSSYSIFFLLLLFLNIDVITKIEGIYLNPGLHLTEFVTYEVGFRLELAWLIG